MPTPNEETSMRRHTLVAALAGLCLAIVPAAALGADEVPTAAPVPEAVELAPAPVAPPYLAELPEFPPAPPGEVSPDDLRPPAEGLPEAPPAPPGELSPF
jgi:hypothetical protein